MPYDFKPHDGSCEVCRDSAGEAVVTADATGVAFIPSRLRREGSATVAPRRHVSSPSDLAEEEVLALWRLLHAITGAIEQVYDPDGLHTWSDVGALADGDGDHYCFVVVPRHTGDGYTYAKPADVPTVHPELRRKLAAALRQAIRP